MARKKTTTTKSHLTLVVAKRLLGFATNVRLVSNHNKGLEEIVMSTENYYNHATAVTRAKELGTQLGVKVVIEK